MLLSAAVMLWGSKVGKLNLRDKVVASLNLKGDEQVLDAGCGHGLMLVAGWHRSDWREVAGQVPRMLASLLFSRLWVPRGNTGRARVSAFRPMPVPDDLRHLFS